MSKESKKIPIQISRGKDVPKTTVVVLVGNPITGYQLTYQAKQGDPRPPELEVINMMELFISIIKHKKVKLKVGDRQGGTITLRF